MKAFLFLPLLISTVLGGFLSGLKREFDEVEFKMIDFYFSMPTSKVNNLISMAQISKNDVQMKGANNIPDFEYKDATVVVKWNGNSKTYEKVTFKTGGMYGRSFDKIGYNIKFDKKFLGRKSFKLRPESGDASKIRSKLCCDIANRIGLPSIQGTYARLYINNEFWGLYTFMDAVKTSWIKNTFDPIEKEVTTLYQCKSGGFNFTPSSTYACFNANDDYQHMSEFNSFVNAANNAKNVSDLQKIMDVDVFLKYLAFEWLIGSFDHFLWYGHNFYWYKREGDGKWVVIYYDYDNTFNNGISSTLWNSKYSNQDGSYFNRNTQPVNYTFADWEKNIPILKKLVYQNQTKFKQIVYDVLVQGFNPDLLNARINEIKNFISPYVKEDFTYVNGKLPGRINKAGSPSSSSYSGFEYNIENSLKGWIKNKFDVACKNYSFNKNDILYASARFNPKPFDYSIGAKPKPTTTTTTTTKVQKTTTTTTTTTTTSQKPTSTGTKYVIIKDGSGKISDDWDNWSWGVNKFNFDSQGNMVNYINGGVWGGVSFKNKNNAKLGSGILYFKARTNDTDALLQVLIHSDDEYLNVGNIENVSASKMVEYGVKIDVPADTVYDRITIQDGKNKGLILCLNDVYFVDGANIPSTTTTVKTTTTTTIKTTTTTTTVKPSPTGVTYNIIKNAKVDASWDNWSWGVESYRFNSQGQMVNTIKAGEWGAVSFKRIDRLGLGSGTLYFKARVSSSSPSSAVQILVHALDEDFISFGNVENIPSNALTQYSVNIKLDDGVKFNRVTIQDASNDGIIIYLDDVYFVEGEVATTTVKPTTTTTTTTVKPTTTTTTTIKTTTTTTTIKTTTTTTTSKPTSTTSSKRYDVIKTGTSKIDSAWEDWSWGLKSYRFNSQGQMVSTINAGEWGAVSFKRTDKLGLGSGTLYFKARVSSSSPSSTIQVLIHTVDEDFISFGNVENIPSNALTQYSVDIKLDDGIKFDRITLQDYSNEGIILYLNDVYFEEIITSSSTTTSKPTTTTTSKPTTTTSKPTTTTSKPTTTTSKPTTTTSKPTTTTSKPTTTTSKPTTTTTLKPTSTSKPNGECKEITMGYYPCGGLSFPDASPCCEEGFKCEVIDEYYHMCKLIM
ncbi:hypothetical protein BCR36DRAFT_315777 [Piromyces finnis]|uniref:CBM1 domain-containing protein n=1 Tax=Piromyces finnis TaxID=1754191 RepID=A0A1Y1VPD0_9FUNG|nr:hypothetical protein BCR36DRAFT_315777 [Piromyces finnis]|eukprot:ORX61246.1 hypothetical protein BCR36DRAFT_315777 [Piromyces finnis]